MVTGSGPSLSTRTVMRSSLERHALEGQHLDRRRAAAQRGRGIEADDHHEQRGKRHERQQRDGPAQGGGALDDAHRQASFASKKPIQPSSANSLWWAWNMNCPG